MIKLSKQQLEALTSDINKKVKSKSKEKFLEKYNKSILTYIKESTKRYKKIEELRKEAADLQNNFQKETGLYMPLSTNSNINTILPENSLHFSKYSEIEEKLVLATISSENLEETVNQIVTELSN